MTEEFTKLSKIEFKSIVHKITVILNRKFNFQIQSKTEDQSHDVLCTDSERIEYSLSTVESVFTEH